MGATPDHTPQAVPVHVAIQRVMADMPGIGKADRSPQGYAYRGIEAITSHLQPLLARHGVVIVPHATTVLNREHSPGMKDGWTDLLYEVTWHVYGPAGDHLQCITHGLGRDNADKGVNKAHTQALKYLLLSLFMVADRADDAEAVDTSADGDRLASAATRRTAPPRTALVAIRQALDALQVTDQGERLQLVQLYAGRDVAGPADLTDAEAEAVQVGLAALADSATTQPPAPEAQPEAQPEPRKRTKLGSAAVAPDSATAPT